MAANKSPHHAGFATVISDVAGVQHRPAIAFNQKHHATKAGMVNDEGSHPQATDLERPPADDFTMAAPVQLVLPTEHRTGQHHLARPRRRIDRNPRSRQVQQAAMVQVTVGKQDRSRRRPVGEQAGQLGTVPAAIRSSTDLPRIDVGSNGSRSASTNGSPTFKMIRAGVGGDLDARAADFVGAPVDGQLHDRFFSFAENLPGNTVRRRQMW